MKDAMLKRIKADALSILATKTEGIKMAESIQDLIDNDLCSLMSCPSCYGLQEKDCQDYSCKTCWQCAIETE